MDVFVSLLINGLATGMLIFLLAAGLTIIFGLMDVLNFAHGGLFAWGAYTGAWTYAGTGSFLAAVAAAMAAGVLLGWVMERFIIQPVYGNHVAQILITLGVMIVMTELLYAVWGPNPIIAALPAYLDGSWLVGNIVLIKYRLFIIVVGLIVFAAIYFILQRTRLGLVVRAGVMNKEMVEALGINIRKLFLIVFMIGSGLAALGGVLFGPYSGVINGQIGMNYGILAFIVVVIGGMGNVIGSALAAVIVGLAGAFMAYYVPELSLAVNMLLMLLVLLFRPSGLFGAKR